MNAKLNRGTCAPARRRGKIRKERDEETEKEEEEEEEYRQLCIAEFGDRYPEYAFRRRNYRGRCAVAREILLFMSRNRVVPEEADTM